MTASLRTVLARLLVAAFAIGSGGARAALQDEPSSANAASLPQPPSAERIKVAEGEHAAARGVGLGPIEEEVLNFRETWTLWRTSAGFDLEGERYYESPRGVGRINHFWLRLSPAMRLVASRDYTRLRWVWASGPLECDLTAGARCHAHPQHPADDLTFELGHPTGFISPLSVFSLSGITRGASQHRRTMTVSLADLRQPSPGSPVILVTHESRLSYLGKASISVAGRNWKASKFRLLVPRTRLGRGALLWVSSDGVLLSVQREGASPAAVLRLVRYAAFQPGKSAALVREATP